MVLRMEQYQISMTPGTAQNTCMIRIWAVIVRVNIFKLYHPQCHDLRAIMQAFKNKIALIDLFK